MPPPAETVDLITHQPVRPAPSPGPEKSYRDFALGGAHYQPPEPHGKHGRSELNAAISSGRGLAGLSSSHPTTGCGTWVMETDWSIAPPSAAAGGAPTGTAVRSQQKASYAPPPEGYRREGYAAAAMQCQGIVAKGVDGVDFRTTNKLQFPPDRGGGPREPIRPAASNYSLGDHARDFGTAAREHFGAKDGPAAAAARKAGNPNTRRAGYNIITGGDAPAFAPYEHFGAPSTRNPK